MNIKSFSNYELHNQNLEDSHHPSDFYNDEDLWCPLERHFIKWCFKSGGRK